MRKSTQFGARLACILVSFVFASAAVGASCDAVDRLWQRESKFGWGEYSIGSEFSSYLANPNSSVRRIEVAEFSSCADRHVEIESNGVLSVWYISGGNDLVRGVFVPVNQDCGREELLHTLRGKFLQFRYTPSRHAPGQPLEENFKPLFSLVADDSLVILVEPGVGVWMSSDKCLD